MYGRIISNSFRNQVFIPHLSLNIHIILQTHYKYNTSKFKSQVDTLFSLYRLSSDKRYLTLISIYVIIGIPAKEVQVEGEEPCKYKRRLNASNVGERDEKEKVC